MRTTRFLLPLIAAAAFGGAADTAAAAERCAERGSRTVESTRAVRVYVDGGRHYACSYATGRRFRLARGGGSVDNAAVAGRYVAYTLGFDNQVGRVETVYVRSVRRGRWIARGIAPEVPERGFERTDASEVTALALAADGTAAWGVEYMYGDAGRQRAQIVALGSDRAVHLLDAGPREDPAGIDTFSLALADGASRAYWMRGAAPRSAPIG